MDYEKRVCALYFALLFAALLLVLRLSNLSDYHTNESISVLDGQYTAKIDVCNRSGFVYDRHGDILSHRKSGAIALVNPSECKDAKACAKALSKYATVSKEGDIYEKIMDGMPFTVLLSEKDVLNMPRGVYTFDLYEERNDIAMHFLGYKSYGKAVTGLRSEYEEFLDVRLASSVAASFDVNAKRKSLSPFTLYEGGYYSTDGLVTTIDISLQSFLDSFEEEIISGAVVVSDMSTGEILALSSFPSYDVENLEEILYSEKGELVNRVCESFTPGSVFKMVVAATALERDEDLWEHEYTCDGSVEVDGNVFRCHKHDGHGKITMKEAFAKSCNTYFIDIGKRLGVEDIAFIMSVLELDEKSDAGFLCEKNNYFVDVENESEGYLANISFGQGDLCLSPLDMTKILTAVSTGYVQPLSVIGGRIVNGELNEEITAKGRRLFSDNTCEKMLIMMKECVDTGTGRYEGSQKVKAGGKTATAQTGRFDTQGVEYVHKWFCGVYPIENPRYSICVLRDFSTSEGVSPAVIFGKICDFLQENAV